MAYFILHRDFLGVIIPTLQQICICSEVCNKYIYIEFYTNFPYAHLHRALHKYLFLHRILHRFAMGVSTQSSAEIFDTTIYTELCTESKKVHKGWCKKNVTTIANMNIAVFGGYKCILYWLIKLSTDFLRFQKAIQTIFIGFPYSTLHFDEYFLTKLWIFQKLIFH